MGHAPTKHVPAITNVLAVSFLEFMQCRLRRSGGTATCKTVDRRDCAPHTVMRAGRPRTRHAHGSIMLHFTRVRMSLSPLASCLSPLASRLIPSRPSPLASRLLPLAPRLSPHPLSPLASRLIPSRLARDGATKPSTDRKPVSPRIAIRRQPMRPGCRGSPAPVPKGPTPVPGSAVPFPTRQRAAASARVTP